MKTLWKATWGVSALLSAALSISAVSPAQADNLAVRCGGYGCDAIHCNYTGDRCFRVDGYRGDYYRSDYSGEGDYDRSDYDRGYYGPRYRPYSYAGYGYYGRLVCDSDGDRCYRSDSPFWNYREYYRRHGYHWTNEALVSPYPGHEYRYTDRLNREEYERSRYGYDERFDEPYDGPYDWRR